MSSRKPKAEVMYLGSSSSSSAKLPKARVPSLNYLICRKCYMEKGLLIHVSAMDIPKGMALFPPDIQRRNYISDNVTLNGHHLSCNKCRSDLGVRFTNVMLLGEGYMHVTFDSVRVLYFDQSKNHIIDLRRTTFDQEGNPNVIFAEYNTPDVFICEPCFTNEVPTRSVIANATKENVMWIIEHCVAVKKVTNSIRYVERPLLEFERDVSWEEMFCLKCDTYLGRFYTQSRDGIRYSFECDRIIYRKYGLYFNPRQYNDIENANILDIANE